MNKLILRVKQFLISESGGHVTVTCIFTLFMCMCGVNPLIALVAGILLNFVFEILLPSKADMKDVMYGGIGASLAIGMYYLALFLNPFITPIF